MSPVPTDGRTASTCPGTGSLCVSGVLRSLAGYDVACLPPVLASMPRSAETRQVFVCGNHESGNFVRGMPCSLQPWHPGAVARRRRRHERRRDVTPRQDERQAIVVPLAAEIDLTNYERVYDRLYTAL